jgi:hypothetical protein
VKSFLGLVDRVGYTRFNAGPLIKLRRRPARWRSAIMGELEVRMLIRAVSELVSLTWS